MIGVMHHFHFLRPWWLLMLIPVLLMLGLLVWFWKQRDSLWHDVCDAKLLPFLMSQVKKSHSGLLFFWLAMSFLLAIIALAGPTWSFKRLPVYESPLMRVIVLNLSASMRVTDIKPNRIVRARYKLLDLLRQSRGTKTGLVVFAGDGYVVSPITDDVSTIENIIPVLEPSLMPTTGNNPAAGLLYAKKLIMQAGLMQHARILLLTDSSGGQAALTQAHALQKEEITLNVLGVGTAEGGPVALKDGNYLTDTEGKIVLSRLNVAALTKLAKAGGGRYLTMSATDTDLNQLLTESTAFKMLNLKKNQLSVGKFWQDKGPLFLLLLLPLALIAFRRGALGLFASMMFPVAMMGVPHSAHAMGAWQSLWSNQNQQALQLYKQKKPKAAASVFKNRKWKAASLYKAKEYQQALELYKHQKDAAGLYNAGNTLAMQGQFQQAIKHYQQALKKEPQNQDAKFNIALLKKLLKKQKKQKKQRPNPKQVQKNHQPHHGQSKQPQQGSSEQKNKNHKHSSGSSSKIKHKAQSRAKKPPKQGKTAKNRTKHKQNLSQNQAEKPNKAHGQPVHKHSAQNANKMPRKGVNRQTQSQNTNKIDDNKPLNNKELKRLNAWIKKIPDNPGGLLRREFAKEYNRRH